MEGADDLLCAALVEAAPDALVVVDEQGVIVLVNAQAEALFGWPRAELVGKAIEVLVPTASRANHVGMHERFVREGKVRPMGAGAPLSGVRMDGTEVPVDVSLSTIRVGARRWVAASVRDVTERRRERRALEEATHFLSAVVREAPVGLLLIRDGGRRVDANAIAERLLGGISADAGNAQFAGRLLWPDGMPIAEDERPSNRAWRGEACHATEIVIRRPDGTKTPALTNASPLLDEAGVVHGVVVAFEDISALKQLERLRAEWNAIVAHDLRQPLNTIALFTQLVARTAKGDAEITEPIEQIKAAAAQLNRMIQDLLDLSRLEAHKLPLKRCPTDLVELVSRCVRSAEPSAAGHRFVVRAAEGLPFVDVDPGRIEQVMQNLLGNAIKYGDKSAPIEIGVVACAEGLEVTITNEGEGIAPESLPRLFQRFQRATDGKLAEVKGVGLGLYITRELVEAHGGRIHAESAPGGRTTFRFTLPVGASEGVRSPP